MAITERHVFDWLDDWEALINARGFEAARALFAADVMAFGTVTGVMRSRAELEERQWRKVWGRIKDFRFDKEAAKILSGEDSDVATVALLWHSLGRTGPTWYERRGRVTLVLRREGEALRCVHSHFSMDPGIPPLGEEA